MIRKNIFTIRRMPIFFLFFTLLFLFATPAIALDGNEILLQVDRNLQPLSYEMYRKLINIEPDGSKKEFILYSPFATTTASPYLIASFNKLHLANASAASLIKPNSKSDLSEISSNV